MEIYTLIVAAMTFVATIILGVFNYRLNNQAKKVEKLRNAFTTVLNNTIGFIELEKKYCETISANSDKTSEAIKRSYRNDLANRINADFSGEQKIKNLIAQIEKL
ncbi:hypothetical protein N9E20_02785 [Crocinitomicaceae bacterium]|nr:hypothetical protein [Crocinitomicaceae bacterium]